MPEVIEIHNDATADETNLKPAEELETIAGYKNNMVWTKPDEGNVEKSSTETRRWPKEIIGYKSNTTDILSKVIA